MGLNIKNERVHDLARQAAAATGLTQTGAIQEALERLLADLGQRPKDARVRARVDLAHDIVLRYAADAGAGEPEISAVEDLYDVTAGLPR